MACRNDRKLFNLKELSRHQKISRKYLENIFGILKKDGLIFSRVGKNGGFYLPAEIKNISLLRILEALEGKVDIVACRRGRGPCEKIIFCPARLIWQELNAAIKKILASKNLKDLSIKREIRNKCSYMIMRARKKST